MRRCCCCSVRTGAVLLGLLNFLLPLIAAIPLIGFLLRTDIPGLNYIQDNQLNLRKVLEVSLKQHEWTADKWEAILDRLDLLLPTIILGLAIYAGVTALFSFLMVLGVRCESRCLMVPFLVLSMVDIVLAGAAGVVVVVALFILSSVTGAVSLLVYVMLAVVSLYGWATVLAAYREVATAEYSYNPVSLAKPARSHQPEYYPAAPQHFVMEEYRDLREPKSH